jgi:2-amino-4-hydroxy-6-hydroxymethyldihydropteridine diphosphokinase
MPSFPFQTTAVQLRLRDIETQFMILIALGANLPFRGSFPAETLRAALATLSENGVKPVKVSSFFETPAWPDPSEPAFMNAVTAVETSLNPATLMHTLHEIESMFGRVRGKANAPRTLDLDLLDYDGRVQSGPPQLPHPRMVGRSFVLLPLQEVAPGWRHPVSGLSVEQLVAALEPVGDPLHRTEKF